jgi:soluble lytic murein transglycosylase-like protein
MKVFFWFLPSLLLLGSATAWADIYQYVDQHGVVHFTNKPQPGKNWKRLVREYSKGERSTAVDPEAPATAGPLPAPNPKCPTCDVVPSRDNSPTRFTRYDRFIQEASTLYQIPVPFIKAVIKAESDFDPRVVSYKSAKGLMQLIPEVEIDMGVKNVFDPRENILGGTRLLRYNANIFRGDMVLTIAAYHAGPNAVKRFGGIPPYKSTRAYVRAVLKYYQQFKEQEQGGSVRVR